MSEEEYSHHYTDVIMPLSSALFREANNRIKPIEDIDAKMNSVRGLIIVWYVAMWESNFINSNEIKLLRNFNFVNLDDFLVTNNLATFYYIRDAFAHSAGGKLFEDGKNTKTFLENLSNTDFPACVKVNKIILRPGILHLAHLITLNFFEGRILKYNIPKYK